MGPALGSLRGDSGTNKALSVLSDLANVFALLGLAFLVFDLAFAQWSWDPLYDLLFLRTDGYILAMNHVSASLLLAVPPFFFALKAPSRAFQTGATALAVVPVHEWVLDLVMWWPLHNQDFVPSFRWLFWLAALFVVGVSVASRRHLVALGKVAVVMALFCAFWLAVLVVFRLDPTTIDHLAIAPVPGPEYLSWPQNLLEVSGWAVPLYVWWRSVLKG